MKYDIRVTRKNVWIRHRFSAILFHLNSVVYLKNVQKNRLIVLDNPHVFASDPYLRSETLKEKTVSAFTTFSSTYHL